MKKIIDELLLNKKYYKSFLLKNYPELFNEIIRFNNNNEISWLNQIYNYYYGVHGKYCEHCGNSLKFKERFSIGYGKYCSRKCTSIATRDIVKRTNLNRYGVEHPLQNKEIREKLIKTNIKKYGVKSTLSNPQIQEKIKNTIKDKYGVEFISQNSEIKEKKRKTTLKKYGVNNVFASKKIQKKIKKIIKDKYDVEFISQNSKIKEKTKKTNLIRYGVVSFLSTDESRKKMCEKNLINFGVEYPLQNNEIREKSNRTIFNKYGVNNISESIEMKKIINEKTIKKWSKSLNLDIADVSYSNQKFIIKNHCKIHNKYIIGYDDLYNRYSLGCESICTKCNKISKQSKIKENELKTFISTIINNYITNDRKILNGKEIDIYVPEHNLGIEFNGLYWHSDKYCNKNYHLNKTEECEKQEIQLLHIFEDEWINKKEIVKSIIKSKLGITENKIFGRKTEVREITDNQLVRDFLNNNHIQGFVGSKIKLGLFYDNELVSVMTFGKKRIVMGNKLNVEDEYEMLRFCNKLDTQVIGGASKMLKYFIKIYHPKSILTFADRRYSQGGLYKQLGFEFIGNTKPNYYYFKKNDLVRHYRFNFRKDVLVKEGFDENKTEHQIMNERGYHSIHDCGNMKFLYEAPLSSFKK